MNLFKIFNPEPNHKNAIEAVKWHLNRYGSIDRLKCYNKYGTFELPSIMGRLRDRHGIKFETKEKTVLTRFGIETRVVTYYLLK